MTGMMCGLWAGIAAPLLATSMVDPPASERPRLYDGGADVVATLSSEQSSYYVGEPVRLTLTVRNDSQDSVLGFFALVSREPRPQILYRRRGEVFTEFGSRADPGRREWRDKMWSPVLLKPGGTQKSDVKLAIDQGTGRLALDTPGEYEFKVILHPAPKDADRVLESNVLVLKAEPVPDAQREAFADYSRRGLATVVQSAWSATENDPAAVKSAAEFLDRHPQGPYSDPLRAELTRALRNRVLGNRAKNEERAVYEKLKEHDPRQ